MAKYIERSGFKGVMRKYYSYLKKQLAIGDVNGRYLDILDSDIFVVSYPKSGNTWMRFLLGNILQNNVDFSNINDIIPDLYSTSNNQLKKYDNPRIIKSHEKFNKKYPKVLYLVRDPRDVVISYYYWHKKYKDINTSIEEYIKYFVDGKNSIFGSWNMHVQNWLNNSELIKNGFLIIKYEELKSNPFNILKTVLDFVNIQYNDDLIKKAIENSDFKNMQILEKKDKDSSTFLKDSDHRINFVRKGGGEWQDIFTDSISQLFYKEFNDTMKLFNYK